MGFNAALSFQVARFAITPSVEQDPDNREGCTVAFHMHMGLPQRSIISLIKFWGAY